MSAATHARPRLLGRLAGLIRGGQPQPGAHAAEYEVAVCRKCCNAIQVLGDVWTCIENDGYLYGETNCGADASAPYTLHEPAAGRDGAYVLPAGLAEATRTVFAPQPAPEPPPAHPPWATAPQPGLAGPGSLDALYVAAALSDQQRQDASTYRDWYGWGETMTDIPLDRARPYAPEPEPDPVPVSYPALSFKADYRDLRVFPAVVRGACRVGLRGIGSRYGSNPPGLPDFRIAERTTAAAMPGGVIL